MFCPNCGLQLADGTAFCSNCGTKLAVGQPQPAPQPAPQPQPQAQPAYQQPAYQQPQYQQTAYQQPQYQAGFQQPVQTAPQVNTTPALVMAIMSLVFCGSGLLGLIFAIVAKNKVRSCVAAGAPLSGKLKAAKILAGFGLAFSIIMMIFWTIYFFIFIGIIIAGGSSVDWADVFASI
ncbi:MAG: zinc ribbon domain-containing protein [Clostridiales bacterium]|nr:zinc ribbon domain-containing protein [Clostridiales bacterium]